MAYNPEEDIKVSDLPEKTTDVVSDDKLLVIDSEDANILKQVDASKVGGGGSGTGDMLKSVYDKNNDGVVDDAEALGGFPASDYAKSADVQPTLESGVNIKTINGNSILGPGNIEIQGGTGTVDTEMSDSSTNAVQNRVIKAYVDSQSGGGGYQVFALTGSYYERDYLEKRLQLTVDDIQVFNQAKAYYLAGGLAIIKLDSAFFYPNMFYASNDSVSFTMLGGGYINQFSVKVSIYEYNNSVYIEAKKLASSGGQYFNNIRVDVDEIDTEYTISSSGNYYSFNQFWVGFKIEIYPSGGGARTAYYSGLAMGHPLLGYGTYSVITSDGKVNYDTGSSSSYEAKIFNLTDTTNRGTLGCNMYFSGAGNDLKFQFTKNRTNTNNTIRAYFYIQTNLERS